MAINESELPERKRLERDLHDRLRDGYDYTPQESTTNQKFYAIDRANVDFVHQWLADRVVGRKVLDYCSGNGIHALWLAEHGAEVHGVDISPVSVANAAGEAARRGLTNAHFHVMDAEAMEFPDDHFDFAVINGVLHHLELEPAYAELARVLKPTGSVLATEALKHNPAFHLYRKRTPNVRSQWEVDHILGRREIAQASRYFSHVEVLKYFHLATVAAVPLRRRPQFDRLLRTLEHVDQALFKVPGIKWLAWMAVFEMRAPKKDAGRPAAPHQTAR